MRYEAGGFLFSVNRFPSHEPRKVRRQTSGLAFHAVGDDADGIVIEESRNNRFIGLDLLKRAPDSGLVICCVLQLYNNEWQAVDEKQYVWTFVLIILYDGKLIDSEELIIFNVVKIYQSNFVASLVTILLIWNLYLLYQELMECFVVRN